MERLKGTRVRTSASRKNRRDFSGIDAPFSLRIRAASDEVQYTVLDCIGVGERIFLINRSSFERKGNTVGIQGEKRLGFEGTQSQECTVSALPFRVDYQDWFRYEYSIRPKGQDWLISTKVSGGQLPKPIQRDSYAVREAFDAVHTPEEAVRFLNDAGRFWSWDHVLWSQFQEWQQFFKWLRLSSTEASIDPLGKMARALANGGGFTKDGKKSKFFSLSDLDFARTQLSEKEIKDIGPGGVRRIARIFRDDLRHFTTFARIPGLLSGKRVLDLHWYDSTFPAPPESLARFCPEARARIPQDIYLSLSAEFILEAIAATIYADFLHGLKFGKCKHCLKLFKIESGHEQQFCPAPRHLKSSPCKNAYTQRKRRDAEKAAREA